LTEVIEAIATQTSLVLKLEDIHWSDASTLDWLAHVARRPEAAKLMVLATFRPADVAASKAGLIGVVAELAVHGHCREIALNPLGLRAVESYLAARLGEGEAALQLRELAPALLERTGGNPLFMVSIVNQLAQRDGAAAMPGAMVAIPHDVRRFIERQIEELESADREVLTAASVVGRTFSAAALAAALDAELEPVEAACARLARLGVFILKSDSAVWPDGTVAEHYAFRHDLHRELLYDRLPAMRRAQSHARVGRRLETAWSGRLDAIAAELAEHFDRGNEHVRAIPHHQRAAANALRRAANQEAIGHLQRALDAVGDVADDVDRTRSEVELRVGIGAAYMAMRGFGAPEVLESYSRAEALCEKLGERVDLFPAIWGQWMFRTGRGETRISQGLCARLLGLADKFDEAGPKIQAHHAMWSTSFVCGELAKSRAHAQSGLTLFDPNIHHAMASRYGNHDAACCARNFSAMALALAGDEKGARAMIDQSLAAARKLDDPFSLALTLYFTSAAAQMLGDVALASENSGLSVQLATEHGLAQPQAWSMGIAGWCAAESGDPDVGVELAKQAVATMRAIQSRHFLAYLCGLQADAHLKAGEHAEAIEAAEEGIAVAEGTGECFYSAELHRLRGELLAVLPRGDKRKAEASFRAAIDIARKQGARVLERRAIESLRGRFG
jgi:predicted ATPase